ncbi:MAG: hypothetical protein Tsb0018_09890 [Opitutales bacterium]|tara:strand:+ start:112 stop:486 length:375 start_codon:yes stop_codon:yes gene_type:complete
MCAAMTWFEIAVSDGLRACAFYEQVFEWSLKPFLHAPEKSRSRLWHIYTTEGLAIGGLYEARELAGANAVEVYLAVDSVAEVLARASDAGGEVDLEKTKIPDGEGYYGRFKDLDGTVIGLWSLI